MGVVVQKEVQQLGGCSYSDDTVVIRQPEKPGDPSVITVNCPDKTGLGCDLCRIILFFGLSIVRGDMSTDGRWCYIVFWVVGRGTTRWGLLKSRLLGACPSAAQGIYSYCFGQAEQKPSEPQVFLLKFWCNDRLGLLHDVTQVLCELELTIRRVKVSTTPDGKVVDLFFITDTRELLHTKKRKEETYDQLRTVLGESMIKCEIELASTELTISSLPSSFLPRAITEEIFTLELPDEPPRGASHAHDSLSVTMDNSLSPSHTLVQILCRDHKGLLYDVMRTLKDYNIQISYGRFYANQYGSCEFDLFVMQVDGKKIIDPNKQQALCSRLRMELFRPLRVTVLNRGPETELLVANPVELSGKGRPLVFYDITLALKMLNTCIFLAEIGRHMIGDREWEVYRVLFDDSYRNSATKNKIEEGVLNMLMGWD
uniref:ACT domain-containing protein ACR n=1 Tax=Anthurium amnicola TaxID=1678845 RepID=A0A1D1Y8N0_9ARAE